MNARDLASKAWAGLVLYFKAWGLLILVCSAFGTGAAVFYIAFKAALRLQGINL